MKIKLVLAAVIFLGAIFSVVAVDALTAKIDALKAQRDKGDLTPERFEELKSKIYENFADPSRNRGDKSHGYCCAWFEEAFDLSDIDLTVPAETPAARSMVFDIASAMATTPNFVVQAAPIKYAGAMIKGPNRYILYNPKLLSEKPEKDWVVLGILAHEIGHHLNGDTLMADGFTRFELAADEFAGRALAKMGATLDQAQLAMKKYGTEEATGEHPGKVQRLAMINKGWELGKKELPQPPPKKNETTNGEPKRVPCTHKIKCKHYSTCSHQIPCEHEAKCVHRTPCNHQGPCQHLVACQHVVMTPFGPRAMHQADQLHPYDTLHTYDSQHDYDVPHPFDLEHPDGDPIHEFDLKHPDGDLVPD